jgi:RNA polymerase sigma-70 factor (ECF subfamily)
MRGAVRETEDTGASALAERPRRPGPPIADRASSPPRSADDSSSAHAREAQRLVEAARNGDPRAFEALVKRYRHRIFALALHMTGSPSDADDITQDAFMRAYRNMHRFEGRSEFFTWLYRIALNRALNVRRDRTRRRTQDLDDPRVTVAVAVDSGGDPHRALELRRTYSYLVRAFDRLSPLLKTTVALTMMQNLSYPEAAVVLETTEGTIAWRIHEARKQMRAALDAMTKDPTPLSLRAPDFARTRPQTAASCKAAPAAAAPEPRFSAPALELALALLAPTV